MSGFPNNEHVQHPPFLFNQKKKENASESHHILVETYGVNVPIQDACVCLFRQFKNSDFGLKDKEYPLSFQTKNKPFQPNFNFNQKKLKILNCKHCWMKTICKLNNK